MKRKPKINFSDEISVRTKVNQNFTVTITVMNHTTQDTLTRVFSFAELFAYKSETTTKREPVASESAVDDETEVSPELEQAIVDQNDEEDADQVEPDEEDDSVEGE